MAEITWTDEEFDRAVQKALEKALQTQKAELDEIKERFLSQAKVQQKEILKEFDEPLVKLKTDAKQQYDEVEAKLKEFKTDTKGLLKDCSTELEKFKTDAEKKQKEFSDALNVKLVGVISGALILVTLVVSGFLSKTSFDLYQEGRKVEKATSDLRSQSKDLADELTRTKENFKGATAQLTGEPGSALALLHNLVNEKQRQLDDIAGKGKRLEKIETEIASLRSTLQALQPKTQSQGASKKKTD